MSCDNIALNACRIAGGIETNPKKITCNGLDMVVGENTKWNMRDKFYELKYSSDDKYYPNVTDKELLKIVDLKIPLNFNRKVFYNNQSSNKGHPEKIDNPLESIHVKTLLVLNKRLNESITTMIKRLTDRYNLYQPLFWSVSRLVRMLAALHKKHKKNKRKIKITYSMTPLIEQIWHGSNYFKYVINNPNASSDIKELIKHMLHSLESARIPKGTWKVPILKQVKYPSMSGTYKQELQDKIMEEKNKLEEAIKNVTSIEETKAYVFSILKIENILIEHLEKIEEYYITHAKNINEIIKSIKIYFSSI